MGRRMLAFVVVIGCAVGYYQWTRTRPVNPVIVFEHPRIEVLPKVDKVYAPRPAAERKPAVQAKPAAVNKTESKQRVQYSFELMQRLADQDEICKVAMFEDVPDRDLARAVSEIASGGSKEDKIIYSLLNGKDGAFNGFVNSPDNSVIVDFFRALLLSDQMSGVSTPELDLIKANGLFQELMKRDRDNAAQPFFAAGNAMLLGKSDVEIKALLREAFSRKRFDSYMNFVTLKIEEIAMRNPSYYLLAHQLLHKIPIPNYTPIHRLLKSYIAEGDAEFNKGALKFCQLMMDTAVKANEADRQYIVMAVDYAIGRNCYLKAWNNLNPEDPEPGIPSYRKFLDRENELTARAMNAIEPLWKTRETICERKPWDDHLARVKGERVPDFSELNGYSRIPR